MSKLFLVLALSSAVFTSAHSAEYVLPSGPGISLAQLQTLAPDYATICESTVTPTCNVDPGTYQVVIYNELWQHETTEIVEIEDTDTTGPSISSTSETAVGSPITLVTQTCFGAPNSDMGCTAFCPANTVATGGACDVSNAIPGAVVSSIGSPTNFRCVGGLIEPNNSSQGVIAQAYCLDIN